ncbi:MAG TPA: head GIN domain-containing protein [Flavobacteriales bacterium]|nr:head GIN domain-containing protein [Flavobacteriales bacterium]
MRSLLSFTLALSLTTHAAIPFTCDHVKGSGEVVKKQITVAAFHGIIVNGSMDVEIVRSDVQSVEVEAQANIAELITTEVHDGVWAIETSKDYSTDKAFTIRIHVPSMDKVHINGSGDVKSATSFKAERVDLGISGSGDITFVAEASSVYVTIEGSGDIRVSGTSERLNASTEVRGDVNASGLTVKEVDARIEGSGDIKANASDNVQANIAGSGDVVLMRNPASMKNHIAGSGEVRVQQQ